MKRIFDFVASILAIVMLLIPFILIAILIKLTSKGPVLYWSERVGRFNINFKMPKFRTMKEGTPVVATDLLQNPVEHMAPLGFFLRRYSLDEIPQIWSILIGNMSFVGPRPALFNQYELINMRTSYGIEKLLPGLTGVAQINGRDDLSVEIKVQYDKQYLEHQSFFFDLKILALTFVQVLRPVGVAH